MAAIPPNSLERRNDLAKVSIVLRRYPEIPHNQWCQLLERLLQSMLDLSAHHFTILQRQDVKRACQWLSHEGPGWTSAEIVAIALDCRLQLQGAPQNSEHPRIQEPSDTSDRFVRVPKRTPDGPPSSKAFVISSRWSAPQFVWNSGEERIADHDTHLVAIFKLANRQKLRLRIRSQLVVVMGKRGRLRTTRHWASAG